MELWNELSFVFIEGKIYLKLRNDIYLWCTYCKSQQAFLTVQVVISTCIAFLFKVFVVANFCLISTVFRITYYKTCRHDIAEILLKVALSTINQIIKFNQILQWQYQTLSLSMPGTNPHRIGDKLVWVDR
jgi:hypothetical protein